MRRALLSYVPASQLWAGIKRKYSFYTVKEEDQLFSFRTMVNGYNIHTALINQPHLLNLYDSLWLGIFIRDHIAPWYIIFGLFE
jgi:hypothetical protein